jgi:hypothetical protein
MNIYEHLIEPFPAELERTVNKSGTSLIYLPIAEVTNRMNRVLGVDGWSSEIIRCERDAHDPDWVVAHVRVTATIQGSTVIHDGFGGQKIKRARSSGDIVDLGDEFKGAVSDATKKALQQFGVGLYLARDPDALEIESSHSTPERDEHESNKMKLYENFKSLRENFDEAQLKELKTWWSEYSGGRPVPKPAEFTIEELENLVAEAVRISLGATASIEIG